MFPQIRDAWAIPLDEFAARLQAIDDMQTEAEGGDLTNIRALRRALNHG